MKRLNGCQYPTASAAPPRSILVEGSSMNPVDFIFPWPARITLLIAVLVEACSSHIIFNVHCFPKFSRNGER